MTIITKQYPIVCPSCNGYKLLYTCIACNGTGTVICTETVTQTEDVRPMMRRNK